MTKAERKQEIENLKDDIVMMGRAIDKWQPDIMDEQQTEQFFEYVESAKNTSKDSKKELRACERLRDFLMDNFFVEHGVSERGNPLIKPIRLWLNEQIQTFGEPAYISQAGLRMLGRAA